MPRDPRDIYRAVRSWLRATHPTGAASAATASNDDDQRRRYALSRSSDVAQRFPFPLMPFPAIAERANIGTGQPQPEAPGIDAPFGGRVVIEPPIGDPRIPAGDAAGGVPPVVVVPGGNPPGPADPVITGGEITDWSGGFGSASPRVVVEESLATGRPSFFDDYFNNDTLSSEWTQWAGTFGLSGGALACSALAGGFPGGLIAYNRYSYTNGHASFKATNAGGGNIGVFIRGSFSAGLFTGYAFFGDAGTTILSEVLDGSGTILGFGPGIIFGQTMEIDARGTAIKAFIDGAVVISAVNNKITDGRAGLLASNDVGQVYNTFHSYPVASS